MTNCLVDDHINSSDEESGLFWWEKTPPFGRGGEVQVGTKEHLLKDKKRKRKWRTRSGLFWWEETPPLGRGGEVQVRTKEHLLKEGKKKRKKRIRSGLFG